jgi:hypothetical protein
VSHGNLCDEKKSFKGEGIYVGRPSVLGNPFAIGRDGDRAEVIAKYRVWLWERVKARGKVFEELVRIKKKAEAEDVYLVFCKPLACHGDVVKACVNWMLSAGVE